MKKKKGNLSELMRFAGRHKYLTYSSWALSVISAALALVPLVYIFFIIKEVIEVAPDFSQATHIVFNGWMAVILPSRRYWYIYADLCVRIYRRSESRAISVKRL